MDHRFTFERALTNAVTELDSVEQLELGMELTKLLLPHLGAHQQVVGDGIHVWLGNVRVRIAPTAAGVLQPFVLTIDRNGRSVITRSAGQSLPSAIYRALEGLIPASQDVITAEIVDPGPRRIKAW